MTGLISLQSKLEYGLPKTLDLLLSLRGIPSTFKPSPPASPVSLSDSLSLSHRGSWCRLSGVALMTVDGCHPTHLCHGLEADFTTTCSFITDFLHLVLLSFSLVLEENSFSSSNRYLNQRHLMMFSCLFFTFFQVGVRKSLSLVPWFMSLHYLLLGRFNIYLILLAV